MIPLGKKLYIQTLGCAMNERDSAHIIAELQEKEHYFLTQNPKEADLILINTCSVREKPEKSCFQRLDNMLNSKNKTQKLAFVVAQQAIWEM